MKQNIENLFTSSLRILIVDDDIAQLSEMVSWLEHENRSLFQARSAEQAERILGRQWIDAVITDWQLPERSGLELIKGLRNSGFKGPLLLCTGRMLSPEHLQAALNAGASDYLRKPLNHVELLARLENAVQRYAQRETLTLLSQSQEQLIQHLTRSLGKGLQTLSHLQHYSSEEHAQEQDLIQTLTRDFQATMEWARYRLSLDNVHMRRFAFRAIFQSLSRHFDHSWHRVTLRGGKQEGFSDPELLQRILFQLINNALKHTTGQVMLQVKAVPEGSLWEVRTDGNVSEGEMEALAKGQKGGLGLMVTRSLLALLQSELRGYCNRKGENVFAFTLRHT